MRLKRRGLIQGYIKVPERSKNGKQHLHVLFRGQYIAQALVSQWWNELHKAKVVDIRKVSAGRSKRGIALYLVKYMSKENPYRYSWNWDWVWRGFCRDWNDLKRYWHQLETYGEYRSFTWLISQWYCWLVVGRRPAFLGGDLSPPLALLEG